MGLTTHASSPPPYSHSNGLVENVIGRIRPLAGSLMHYMSEQVGVDFSSTSPWWSWALRHAAWLINRFSPTKGMSAFEIVHGKEFTGKLCRFGEPVFGYCKVEGKATAKWKRMLFVGKTEPHDTYILYDGSGLVLTRSVRHIDVNWKSHLKYYYMFSHWSWEYKPGYGGRVLPTKSSKTALGASYSGPTGSIEPSPFVDEDAEAVRQKHLEEVREEEETNEMSLHDRPQPASQAEIQEEPAPASPGVTIDKIFCR